MKFDFDLDLDENELTKGLKSEVKQANEITMGKATQKARSLANSRLRSGREHWHRGFEVHKVDEDTYIMTISGKLADWMESGIQRGEISDAIMSGNRAQHNKAEGKEYVDVPIGQDVDQAGNIGQSNVNVAAFKDADSLMRSFQFSDYKRKAVKQEQRITSRVKDIIKSVDPSKDSKTSYLKIRRVSKDSVWPKNRFEGAQVFKDLEDYIEKTFVEELEKIV